MSDARSEDGSMDDTTDTESVVSTSEAAPTVTPPVVVPPAVIESKEIPVVAATEAPKVFKLGRFVIAATPKPEPKVEVSVKEDAAKQVKVSKVESSPKTAKSGTTVPPASPLTPSVIARNSRRKFTTIVVALVVVGGFLLFINSNKSQDLSSLTGKVALSASELHDLVAAKHITVYWAGPMDGAKYTLTANTPGTAVVKYFPGGVGLNDTKTLFRAIGTYGQKNAYQIAKNSGASPGNVGFSNADGNAIFYASSRPSNVYIGIKGKDTQVEVFDPVVDQALGLVLVRNQIRLVA